MAYEIAPDERLGPGLRRIARDELQRALESLQEELETDRATAVHDARKRLKKARSLLRLSRPVLGAKLAQRENAALRAAAASLADARDAEVMARTVDALADRYVGRIPATTFRAVRRVVAGDDEARGAPEVDGAVKRIRMVLARVDAWPLDGVSIEDVLAGEATIYAAGRKQRPRPGDRPTAVELHEWRKRVKDLWYHERLLRDAWPPILRAHAKQAHRLTEILGENHDLAVLREHVTASTDDLPVDVDGFLELVDHRRAALLGQAVALGRRVYAEKPKAHTRRLRRYLRARSDDAAVDG